MVLHLPLSAYRPKGWRCAASAQACRWRKHGRPRITCSRLSGAAQKFTFLPLAMLVEIRPALLCDGSLSPAENRGTLSP